MQEATRLAIYNYIQTNWGNQYPLFAENQGEQQPAGPFGRYSIRNIDTVSMAVGSTNSRYRRTTARLWFQFFGIEGQGTKDATTFADLITNMFDEKYLPTGDGMLIRFKRNVFEWVGIEPSGRPQWKCTVMYEVDDL
jgi:hypothetical protein